MVRWGILSTARINDLLLEGARAAEGATVVAVASRDPERARRYADERGIERAYGGYEELLADPDIDAVYVPLPNALHQEWAVTALRAGKHVLCEKPLSRSAAEVEEAFEVAEAEGRLLMEAFMYRHHPQTRRVAELVASGAIGRLSLIHASFSFRVASEDDVRLQAGLAGGALMDVGCYCVSAARMLAGEPERVTAQQRLGGDGVDVVFTGTMAFPGGVLAHFDAGLELAPRFGLEVVGDEGSLWVADPWHARRPGIELRRDDGLERIDVPAADAYRLEVENLSAAIAGRGEPLLGREDAVGQARALEALYAAAEEGRQLRLGELVSRHG